MVVEGGEGGVRQCTVRASAMPCLLNNTHPPPVTQSCSKAPLERLERLELLWGRLEWTVGQKGLGGPTGQQSVWTLVWTVDSGPSRPNPRARLLHQHNMDAGHLSIAGKPATDRACNVVWVLDHASLPVG